jgi:hypothetical protein
MIATTSRAQTQGDVGWPREIEVPEGKVVIYQPQADVLDGNILKGRGAISFTAAGKTAPVFGAAWFEAQVDIDRDARLVSILTLTIPKCRFGESTPEQEKQLAGILERELPKTDLTMSLDRLMAGLKVAESERIQAEGLNTAPPKIYFETSPAVLIVMDGDPQPRPVEGAKIQRVVNTPYFVVFHPESKTYWTKAGSTWFSTSDVKGAWRAGGTPPAEAVSLQAKAEEESKKLIPPIDEAALTPDEKAAFDATNNDKRIPKIIVSTVPAELIVTNGEPQFKPLVGSDLLEMTNTNNDVFMEVGGQDFYVVFTGRWYQADTMNGPWSYVRSDKLPASFAKISPASDRADVRTFVAGTEEADDALIDAQVPQTAAVLRSEAKLSVTYDGEPRFESVPSTSMKYAVNTATSVLLIDRKYYACKDAVWFVSSSATGPWVLADSVPAEVRKIPPESPVYNVKYVYVYESTPQVVYVGYLPGYVGGYPYYGTVVYGTGWYYRPWIGPVYYYPRPVTYGVSVHYNPWYGWSFGVGVSVGWAHVTIWGGGGYHGGFWGPAGYYPRPPYHGYPGYGYPGYRPPGYRPGYPPPGYRPPGQPGYRPPGQPGYRPPAGGASTLPANRANLYGRPNDTVGQGVVTRDKQPAQQPTRAPKNMQNNVYTDKSGNVYRRDQSGNWDQRDKGAWKPTTPQAKPTTPQAKPNTPQAKPNTPQAKPTQQPAPTQQLQRDYQARQQGSQKAQSFQGSGGASQKPSSAPHSGGTRKR